MKKDQTKKIQQMISELATVKAETVEAKIHAANAEQHALNLLNHFRDLDEDARLSYIAELEDKIRRLER